LARVGYDYAIGFLKGGISAWVNAGKESDSIETVDVDEVARQIQGNQVNVLDVRRESEYNAEHIEGAINTPLDFINDQMASLDKGKNYLVHCAGGYRSMIFISVLRARGFDNMKDIKGGFNDVKNSGKFKINNTTSQTKMKI
jgi:rhodanese-related sulfurtransferase